MMREVKSLRYVGGMDAVSIERFRGEGPTDMEPKSETGACNELEGPIGTPTHEVGNIICVVREGAESAPTIVRWFGGSWRVW